jgi:multicomponent Na+:H+ antiporter subunit D
MLLPGPIVLGFLAAIALFALRGTPMLQRAVSLTAALAQIALSFAIVSAVADQGVIVAQMSAWPAPFGITLAADALSAAMLLVTAIAGFFVILFGFSEISGRPEQLGYHSFVHMLLGGVSGAFVTGDIFNLYVWFEVLLIASFGLLVVQGGRRQLDGAMRYVALNLVATIAFLTGVGLLYGATGALNMADLHRAAGRMSEAQTLVTAALLLFAFGAKAAMFPAFFWLPASYHTPFFAISALFSALLTKVGVYSMLRVFTLIYGLDTPYLSEVLVWGGALTMIVGVLGALAQRELRLVLAWQVIASIGFMVAGIGVGTAGALTGSIFYMLQDMLVKVALFTTAWLVARRSGTESLVHAGGLWMRAPWLGALFLMPALALAGIPPFSGFWAKVLLIDATLKAEFWWLAGVALVVGLLTLYSMAKVFSATFWQPRAEDAPAIPDDPGPRPIAATVSVLGLVALIAGVGIWPASFIDFTILAGHQLAAPDAYIEAVLGGQP